MKFLSPKVALYLYRSTLQPCTKYCYHVWAGAPSCYFELLDKLQKQICRTVGPSLATSLKPLSYCWNVTSLSIFYRFYFGRCSSQLAQLVPLPFSQQRSTRYFYISSFFPGTARIWNSLPVECFCLTNDLNGLKSIINRHLINCRSFLKRSAVYFNFLCFFFLELNALQWLFSLAWNESQVMYIYVIYIYR